MTAKTAARFNHIAPSAIASCPGPVVRFRTAAIAPTAAAVAIPKYTRTNSVVGGTGPLLGESNPRTVITARKATVMASLVRVESLGGPGGAAFPFGNSAVDSERFEDPSGAVWVAGLDIDSVITVTSGWWKSGKPS